MMVSPSANNRHDVRRRSKEGQVVGLNVEDKNGRVDHFAGQSAGQIQRKWGLLLGRIGVDYKRIAQIETRRAFLGDDSDGEEFREREDWSATVGWFLKHLEQHCHFSDNARRACEAESAVQINDRVRFKEACGSGVQETDRNLLVQHCNGRV
eukprot:1595409-Rhodomonas_salina.3